MFQENCPIKRGSTFTEGLYTPDASNLPGAGLVGTEWLEQDIDYSATTPVKPLRTNRIRKTRLVRNTGGFTMLPKRAVSYSLVAGEYGNSVNGYTTTTACPRAGVVDEFLVSTGVVDDDVFHITVAGPTLMLTDIAAVDSIGVGDVLVALTAATSQCTTAGRVDAQDLTGATALLANQTQWAFGAALSAKTSGNTNADILVDFFPRW